MNTNPDPVKYLSAPQVLARYGGRSHMWLERKLKGKIRDKRFPDPIYFGRLRFFELSKLEEWERACASGQDVA
jgi:predicted DNA-binding transcriptional regulator AlpA